MLGRLLSVDFETWNQQLEIFKARTLQIKVPSENTPATLHHFNISIDELYSEVILWHSSARANKDAIQRFIKNVLEDAYQGKNEAFRRAAGIQMATSYLHEGQSINLFDLEYTFNEYFYLLEAIVKSLEAKMTAKITNNSLLNLERDLMPKG